MVATTTAPPPITSRCTFGFANPFGVSSSRNSSSVIRGAFVAFSNPTSISMLIFPPRSLGVNLFHFPDRTRHSRLEAVPRLIHFFFRKLHSQIRHLHFISRRLQIQQRRLHVQRDLVPQIVFLLIQLLDLQVCANYLRVYPSTGKQRHIYAGLVGVGGQRRVSRRSHVREISIEPQRGQPRILRCFLLIFRGFDLRFQRLPLLALRQREFDAWLHFRLRRVEETQRIRQLDGLPRIQAQ